ncbi:hypothetical protein DFS34DRAFT_481766 [Phlyctochytrium arcticum]|nr:hypothetical protein DFS34DRAFT_481766 [Phlyctochytrium arcticum]
MLFINPIAVRRMPTHGLSLAELRTVSDVHHLTHNPPLVPTNPHMTRETARQTAFPRVIQNRARIAALERELEENMLREFQGLSVQQRSAILKIVKQNRKVRKEVGRVVDWLDGVPMVGEDERSEGGSEEARSGEMDVEFPIVEQALRSNELRLLEESARRGGMNLAAGGAGGTGAFLTSSGAPSGPITNPTLKYAQFANDRRKHASAHASAAHDPSVPSTDQTLAYEAMKQVTQDLKTWVTTTLDPPTTFDPENPLAIPGTASAPSVTLQQQQSGPPPQATAATGELGSGDLQNRAAINSVDTEGFDVLLNACKPTILEAKPSVRLKIVRESNPPEALVQTLRENLGVQVGRDNANHRATTPRRRRPGASDDSGGRKGAGDDHHRAAQAKYGAWYIRPTMWNDFMRKNEQHAISRKRDPNSSRRFGGIVQNKLDEIMAHRAREDAQLFQGSHGNLMTAGAGPTTAGGNGSPSRQTRRMSSEGNDRGGLDSGAGLVIGGGTRPYSSAGPRDNTSPTHMDRGPRARTRGGNLPRLASEIEE